MSDTPKDDDEEDRKEMDRVAANLGFKSAKDMAGALLDHEIETTQDIERLRFWAQNLRKLSTYKIDKLERNLTELRRVATNVLRIVDRDQVDINELRTLLEKSNER